MRLTNASADLYVPDALPMPEALSRTTHLCVGAHQDDQELMAFMALQRALAAVTGGSRV